MENVGAPNDQGRSVADSSATDPSVLETAQPLSAAQISSMFATLESDIPDSSTWSTSYAGARRILATILHLQSLVYVPGLWRCAKCGCTTIAAVVCASTGAMAANKSPQQCPNSCGPMWRVTERQAGNDVIDRTTEANEKLAALLGGIPHSQIYDAVEKLVARVAEERGMREAAMGEVVRLARGDRA